LTRQVETYSPEMANALRYYRLLEKEYDCKVAGIIANVLEDVNAKIQRKEITPKDAREYIRHRILEKAYGSKAAGTVADLIEKYGRRKADSPK